MKNIKSYSLAFLLLIISGGILTGQCPVEIYDNFKFTEGSGNIASGAKTSSIITLTNPEWISGILNQAVSFNGSDSEGLLNDSYFNWTANEDFSLEFWVRLETINPSENMVFIGRDDPATPLHWWIGAENATAIPIFVLRDNQNTTSVVTGNSPLTVGVWHHIVVVRSNTVNQNQLFLDGVLSGSSQVDYNADFSSTAPVNLGFLNYNGQGSYHADCSIDEFMVIQKAISTSEVILHYQNQLNGISICDPLPDTTANNKIYKILPLGNSITFDFHSNDTRTNGQRPGYRMPLYNMLSSAGIKFDFVGSETAGQDLFSDPENGGFPGINKEQLVTLLNTGYDPRSSIQVTQGPYLNVFQPDIILLHIGTNDLTTDVTAISQILDIIDSYRTASGKDVKLLIAKIINRQIYNEATTIYNNNLEELVQARQNEDNIIVDMENGAGMDYSNDMIDNLHPNAQGYEKMANKWYSVLMSFLSSSDNCSQALTGYWDFDETSSGNSYSDRISEIALSGNSEVVLQQGLLNNALLFNGSNSQADISDAQLFNWLPGSNFSIQFWMKKSTTCVTNENNVIIGRNDQSGSLHWWVGVECGGTNQGSISMYMTSNAGDNIMLTGSSSIIDNTWHLVTITHENNIGTTCLYIDGNLEVFDNRVFTGSFVSEEPVNIGWLNLNPYYHFDGSLDELAVYNKALTHSEVQTYYNAGLENLNYCSQGIILPPLDLNAEFTGDQIELTWTDNSINEYGFRIERKSGSGAFEQIAQLAANSLNYSDTELQPSTSYTYRVYAFNSIGSSVFSNESTAQTPAVSAEITNLAPGKPVTQSSTANSGVPERANDGNTNGAWSGNSVSHSGNEASPYWQINLLDNYTIDHIEVWNRTDACCMSKMAGFYVFVSDVPFASGNLNTTISQNGVWHSFQSGYPNPSTSVAVNRSGQYVRVQLAEQGELTMAEVEIFGSAEQPPVTTAPEAPTMLTSQPLSSQSIQLGWTDNAINETGFRIERKSGSGAFEQITQLAANSLNYSDTDLQPSTSYTYRVYAFNSIGSSAFSNESTAQTPAVSAEITNLAPGKPVTQSSTANSGVPERANDGNTNGAWSGNSVSHSGNEASPYWQINLLDNYTIDHIEVWNRTDACCMSKMAGFYVFVSDVPFTSGNLNTTISQNGVWHSFQSGYPNPSTSVAVNRSGQYVRVQLAEQGELTMAEVEIFGSAEQPPVTTAPEAPTMLTSQPLSTQSIQLGWTDNAINETGFRIERKSGSGAFEQIAQLAANSLNYSDTDLQPSTSYTYRAYAFNSIGNSAFSNESTAQTPAVSAEIINLAPGKPVTQSSTAYSGIPERANDNNTNGAWSGNSVSHSGNEASPYWQINLLDNYTIDHIEVWNRTDACCISRMAGFYVFVSDMPFASGNLNATISQNGVWHSFQSGYPNPSTSVAVNRSGQYVRVQLPEQGELTMAEVKIFGSTEQPPVTTAPEAPTLLALQTLSPGSIRLDWTDNAANETGFRIERKSGSGAFEQIAQLAANTLNYSDTDLQPLTSYTYRAYAFNSIGNSAFSNESTAQTPAVSAEIINLAPGKPVTQSSTAYSGIPERANDNNTNGAWSGNSVSHSGNEASPYWQINLLDNYTIDHIEVWNRTDACCVSRMANYYVFVSDVAFTSGNLASTINQSGVWNTFSAVYPNPSASFAPNRTGQYIRIQLANQGELSMAEVKIYGSESNLLKSTQNNLTDLTGKNELELQIYPNPSMGETTIAFHIDHESYVSASLYDIVGIAQKKLIDGLFASGNQEIKWDGTGPDGRLCESGLYFIRLTVNNNIYVRKVIITKPY